MVCAARCDDKPMSAKIRPRRSHKNACQSLLNTTTLKCQVISICIFFSSSFCFLVTLAYVCSSSECAREFLLPSLPCKMPLLLSNGLAATVVRHIWGAILRNLLLFVKSVHAGCGKNFSCIHPGNRNSGQVSTHIPLANDTEENEMKDVGNFPEVFCSWIS